MAGKYANDKSDWVVYKDHHPAIISEEQHRQAGQILDINVRYLNAPGSRVRKNVHVFGGIVYCGKCGRAMHSTPGRLSSSGYRPTKYNCPAIRKGNTCDNPYVNDNVIGEFVLNLILNIMNSQKLIDDNANESSLQQMLLKGDTFKNVCYIDRDGLGELLGLLTYPSDGGSVFKPRMPKTDVPPKTDAKKIRAERLKIERALDRLKKLYLYSDEGMSETEYIVERSKLTDQLAEYDQALDDIAKESVSKSINDEDFIHAASQFIISQQLQNKPYVSYRRLASTVDPIVLRNFFDGIIDSINVADSQVTGIAFRNGLYLSFVYKPKEPSA